MQTRRFIFRRTMNLRIPVLVLLLTATVSLQSFAGGFQVNLQGQKQTGMGHCGTGLVMGASSSFFNPGAFAFVDESSLSLGASFIKANVAYLEEAPGIYQTRTEPGLGTPFTFYAAFRHAQLYGQADSNGHRLKKPAKWNLGLAAYTPFGSRIRYQDDWLGQFVLRELSLKIIFLQTTLGFQVTDKLGVGIAHVYGFGDFYLRKGVPTADANGAYGEGTLEGTASGHGMNAGIYYQASDKLSLGVSYRTSVTVVEEDGSATFSVPSSLKEFFPSTTFSTSISLPQVINFGVGYKLNEKTTLAYDFSSVGWSIYDSLIFDFAENTDKLDDIRSPRHYRNTMIFRLGVEHKQSEKFIVRAGAYYDMTPVEDGYITPETPGSNKIGVTAGASILLSEHLILDLSFLYLEGAPRTDTNLETGFGGTWKAKAYIPGFALEYIF